MPGAPIRTLHQAVRRAHTRIALVAVAVAGVLLLAAGLAVLRANAQNNLELMARALAYNLEGALVFGDRLEATASLGRMVQDEDVAEVTVWDAGGKVFAQWAEPVGTRSHGGRMLAQWMGLQHVEQEVVVDGSAMGRVALHSNGGSMLGFLLSGVLALALCMGASIVVGRIMSRRMHRNIVAPLQELGRVARAVHRERAMGQRVPPADIAELRELGEHFNALLDELEARQLHLQQENTALEHKAYHDGLTGMYNRVYFELRLMSALRHASQTGGQLALLFMDNDHFKRVNDSHGHATGDALLVEVARRIEGQVRNADLVARLGGDEFVVLLLEPRSRQDVQHVADKIQDAMRLPLVCGPGVVVQPALSIGVAMYPAQGRTMEALLAAADRAMYESKLRARQGLPSR